MPQWPFAGAAPLPAPTWHALPSPPAKLCLPSSAGADPACKDFDGKTPLHDALEMQASSPLLAPALWAPAPDGRLPGLVMAAELQAAQLAAWGQPRLRRAQELIPAGWWRRGLEAALDLPLPLCGPAG